MKYIVGFEIAGAVVLAVLGGICLFLPVKFAVFIFYAAALLMSLSAILLLYEAVRKKKGILFLGAAVSALIAIIFWTHQTDGAQLASFVFAVYMIGCSFIEAVQFILDVKNRAARSWIHLLSCLAYLAISIAAFVFRSTDVRLLMRLFGAYCLYQALQIVIEIFWFSRPHSSRAMSFRMWSALPVYIVGVLPSIVLRVLLTRKMDDARRHYDEHKNNEPVNLRVFIHTGLTGDHLFGHMTFSYKGIMFSYGNYDKAEERFFRSIGPGVLFTVPADIYVNNSCLIEGSTIFEFGLHLDEKQEQKLQSILRKTFSETYRWYCPIEKIGGRADFEKLQDDYTNRLSYRTGAKFRKFYHGMWKTYWIAGDNCSLFADDVLSQIDCHIVHKSGIVSPGEYFEFFTEAYQDPNSNVVFRSWHDPNFPDTLYSTLA